MHFKKKTKPSLVFLHSTHIALKLCLKTNTGSSNKAEELQILAAGLILALKFSWCD